MAYMLPPIAKDAERLLLNIEQAVRGFARYQQPRCGQPRQPGAPLP